MTQPTRSQDHRKFTQQCLQISRTHGEIADTGWEPRAAYENVARLRKHASRYGIPVRVVSAGDIRADALDPARRFASMPLHVLNPDGSTALGRRQCTSQYKVRPLKREARQLLGFPHPKRVPPGVYAEQAIGISTDEFARAKDADVQYLRNVFPLLELGWDRATCLAYLAEHGFGSTVRSACLGCPFHGNSTWRWIRDHDPRGWEQAVEFDKAIRHGYERANQKGQRLRGSYYLHHSCRPLDQADLDAPPAGDSSARNHEQAELGDPDGCSPWSCRSGTAVNPATDTATDPDTDREAA